MSDELRASILDLQRRGDARGWLVAIQDGSGLPFPITRVYYVGGVPPNTRRGAHAHHRTHQAAICVAGACTFLLDNGRSKATLRLDTPNRGVLLPPMLWHEMYDFTADCVLLVLADLPYDEADYIRSYDVFLREVSRR
jgi:dTDP-4-dehydrorhamnose 3,5-epimerase-like enzyme